MKNDEEVNNGRRSAMKKLLTVLAMVAMFGFAGDAQAAMLSFNGGDFTTHDAWRTTSVIKALDADGDNVYGTDGYLLFNSSSAAPTSQPSYLTASNVAPSQYGPAGNYVPIDDPAITPGAGPIANINTGTAFQGGHPTETDFVSLSVTVAGSFRIGVLQDNHDLADISPASLRLRQTVGGSADTGPQATNTDRNVNGDWYFFTVTNAAFGDVFVLSGIAEPGGHPANGIGGVTFDHAPAVPEPSTFVLAGLGLLGLGFVALRKKFRRL